MKTTITFTVLLFMCVLPGYTYAQLITISGYVKHAITDVAIENASVFEKRSEIGTISNKEGFFKLMLHPGRQNISFSENGFKTFSESILLKNDTTVTISLKPEKQGKNAHKDDTALQAGLHKKKNSRVAKQN